MCVEVEMALFWVGTARWGWGRAWVGRWVGVEAWQAGRKWGVMGCGMPVVCTAAFPPAFLGAS